MAVHGKVPRLVVAGVGKDGAFPFSHPLSLSRATCVPGTDGRRSTRAVDWFMGVPLTARSRLPSPSSPQQAR